MKKIFLLLILLLNLHIAINEGGISLESGHVFAQIQYEETLEELVVPGNAYGICEYCKSQILKSELLFHQQHQCYYREATCDICHQRYRPAEGDCPCKYNNDSNDNNNNNNENDYTICYKCGQLKKQCTCKENNPDERNPTNSISLGGGSGGSHSGGNGNTEEHQTDSVGYHKCPCLISLTTHILRSSIDNNQMLNELNDNYWELTEGLKRHIAFPETIQQGNNGTCASALIQKYLAENYPNEYIECVYALAKSKKYEPWNLEIPASSMLSGITDYELSQEDGDKNKHDMMYSQGINFTAVDALMQTAIQNWADNYNLSSRLHNSLTGYTYSVIFDTGNDGGMFYEDRLAFLSYFNPTIISDCSFGITDEELSEKLQTYSPDSYTIMAGVNIESAKDIDNFGKEQSNHALEIRGLNDGYIDYWTWGKYGTTKRKNNYIGNLTIIKKTEHALQEKNNRRDLTCTCEECNNTHCSICM